MGKPKRKKPLENLDVDEKKIWKRISKKRDGVMDRIDLFQDKVAGAYERGNEPSGCIKCGKFLD